MFHNHEIPKNKQQKHPKVYFKQYISSRSEPEDDMSGDMPEELEGKLLGNSNNMRRHFRQIAQSMRNRYY